jgi:uncharacterized protein (DUF58 family)
VNLILKVLYRPYWFVSTVWRWGKRRFTTAGFVVLIAVMAAGTMGPDTENNVAYQGFTLLLFLLLVAVSFCVFFRARFAVARSLPRFGTVGQPLHYNVRVQNLSPRMQLGLTLLDDLEEPRPSSVEWRAVQLAAGRSARSFRFSQRQRLDPFRVATLTDAPAPNMHPNEECDVGVQLTPLRRGLLRFKNVTIARPDPLGLFRGFVKVPAPQTVLILPKRYPLPPIALPGTMKYQEGGVALASSVGQSEEFVALRDYRRGDPLRHIHWRSWAKTGEPVVKEFEDEFFVRHALVLDTFTAEFRSEVFEEAIAVAASFACAVRTQESLLDLLFVGPESYCFTAGRGLAHADQMLEILASVRPCGEKSFGSLEHLVLNHVKAVSGCICVLLDWDESRQEFIKKIRLLGVPVLVLVVTGPRASQELDPGPMRDDPGRFHVLQVGSIEQGLAKLY